MKSSTSLDIQRVELPTFIGLGNVPSFASRHIDALERRSMLTRSRMLYSWLWGFGFTI
jgi:hypothetical protein